MNVWGRGAITIIVLTTILQWGLSLSSANDQWVWVKKIIDGDTIRLKDGRTVRYLGIDAPEIKSRYKDAEPFGYTAKKANRNLVAEKQVRLVIADVGHDQYGRILAQVFKSNGKSVGRCLVEQGMAVVVRTASTEGFDKDIITAQRTAMGNKRGLWTALADIKGPFIGNKRSYRFHRTTCPYAQQTHTHNQISLGTLWECYWHGFSPCSRCLPSTLEH